ICQLLKILASLGSLVGEQLELDRTRISLDDRDLMLAAGRCARRCRLIVVVGRLLLARRETHHPQNYRSEKQGPSDLTDPLPVTYPHWINHFSLFLQKVQS